MTIISIFRDSVLRKYFGISHERLNKFFPYVQFFLVYQDKSQPWFTRQIPEHLRSSFPLALYLSLSVDFVVYLVKKLLKIRLQSQSASASCLQFFSCKIHMKCWICFYEWELTTTPLDKCESGIRSCQFRDILIISIYEILHADALK